MNKDKLKQLRNRRAEAVLAVGAIDKEISDALKDVPPLKVGDVYVTEPFRHWSDKWVVIYYIIVEQDSLDVRHSTNHGIHTNAKTLHFVVEQDHDHKQQVGFMHAQPQPHMSTWEYKDTSRRWTIDTDWEHDMPRFLCNLVDDKYTKEYWGRSADRYSTPTVHAMLEEELMHGMNSLEMPNYFAGDEVELRPAIRLQYEVFCLRMWVTHKLSVGHDGLPDWMFVEGGYAQPFRWYSSDGRYSDKGMFTLTEEGWLDSELERYTPKDAENTSDEDMANWASHLELVEYDKNN